MSMTALSLRGVVGFARQVLFGQNIFVTSTGGEFVLRGAPHHEWQFRTEQFFARMVAERTRVPAPCPFLIDQHTDIFGWSFAIMPKMGHRSQASLVISRWKGVRAWLIRIRSSSVRNVR